MKLERSNYVAIKCHLPIIMAKRRLKMVDVINGTGISKVTIHSLYHEKNKAIHLKTIEALCNFFDCEVSDLLEFVKDD